MQVAFHTDTQRTFQPQDHLGGQRHNFARSKLSGADARTAGSIRTLTLPSTAQQTSLDKLAQAADPEQNFETALSYASNIDTPATVKQDNGGYTFYDVLDVVNPLQHIPLVSTLYRGITGDEIKPAAQIIGGTIYGGPVGAVSSTVNVVVQHETGRDLAGNALALVAGDAIRQPEISIDMSRQLLSFDDDVRTAPAATQKKSNFSNAASAYQKAGRYNS